MYRAWKSHDNFNKVSPRNISKHQTIMATVLTLFNSRKNSLFTQGAIRIIDNSLQHVLVHVLVNT